MRPLNRGEPRLALNPLASFSFPCLAAAGQPVRRPPLTRAGATQRVVCSLLCRLWGHEPPAGLSSPPGTLRVLWKCSFLSGLGIAQWGHMTVKKLYSRTAARFVCSPMRKANPTLQKPRAHQAFPFPADAAPGKRAHGGPNRRPLGATASPKGVLVHMLSCAVWGAFQGLASSIRQGLVGRGLPGVGVTRAASV